MHPFFRWVILIVCGTQIQCHGSLAFTTTTTTTTTTTRQSSNFPRRWNALEWRNVEIRRRANREFLHVAQSSSSSSSDETATAATTVSRDTSKAETLTSDASDGSLGTDDDTQYLLSTMETKETTMPLLTPQKSDWNSSVLLWRGAVVGLCAVWASNFAVAKLVMSEPNVDSSLYALSRFSVAALALSPGAIQAIRKGAIDVETAKGAAICGGWVAFGYLGQTLGLLTTTASRSCIICTLHCVFVAVVAESMRVSKSNNNSSSSSSSFDWKRLIPAAVAVLGVAIVELKGAGGQPTIGDALSFAQPVGFGLGYLQLEELMKKRPQAALPVSAIKLIVVALASFLLFEVSPATTDSSSTTSNLPLHHLLPDFTPILSSPIALGGILYTGLITTALALYVESIAFRRVPATDASLILTTEPLFAAGAGALTLGETFGMSDYVGATLIVGACILAVLIDDDATDEQCDVEDALEGKCEPPRTFPISAE